MSLLTSLLKASTQFQQAATARKATQDAAPGKTTDTREAGSASQADRFTRSGEAPTPKTGRLSVTEYRQQVGQDLAYLRETLRHKLAEYSLRPGTEISVNKGADGRVEVMGRMPEEPRLQIQQDLNHSQTFRDTLGRLAQNEPALAFVDTALKLNQAYGANNTVLDSLVSEDARFNGLQDLVHRYDTVRRTFTHQFAGSADNRPLPADPGNPAGRYSFSLNARA